MKLYNIRVFPNGEIPLPPTLLEHLRGEKKIIIRKVRAHYVLLHEDGKPIVMPEKD